MRRYKLTNTEHSSSRFGPCEVCKKRVSEVYHQTEEEKYSEGWTRYNCHDFYGHRECLMALQFP